MAEAAPPEGVPPSEETTATMPTDPAAPAAEAAAEPEPAPEPTSEAEAAAEPEPEPEGEAEPEPEPEPPGATPWAPPSIDDTPWVPLDVSPELEEKHAAGLVAVDAKVVEANEKMGAR